MKRANHGGAFLEAAGTQFDVLWHTTEVVSADVLDAWFDPSPKALDALREFAADLLRMSPPTHSVGLVRAISEVRRIPIENILVSSGSSSLIFTVLPQLIGAETTVLIVDPSYGEYPHVLQELIRARVVRFNLEPEDDFRLHPSSLWDHIAAAQPQFVILVNPNNPTGSLLERNAILDTARHFDRITFIVDEAYVDYVGPNYSVERHVEELSNLIVIKSMSKVYALSGARVAYMVCPAWVIKRVGGFVPPWAVSFAAQVSAVLALGDGGYYQEKYDETHRLRQELTMGLNAISYVEKAYDGTANFVFVRLHKWISASSVVESLKKDDIYLRDCKGMSARLGDSYLRVGVMSAKANQAMLSALTALGLGQ
jgi:histidinol-phosphate/aromatic aminotransferase/cobyric acid decarboxylase-like protein